MRHHRLAGILVFALALGLIVPTSGADAAVDPTSPAEMQWVYDLNLIRQFPEAHGLTDAPTPPAAISDSLAAAADEKAAFMIEPGPPMSQPWPAIYCAHTYPKWSNRLAVDNGFPLPGWWDLDNNYVEATWCSSGQSAMPSAFVFIESTSPWHKYIVLGQDFYDKHREVGVGYDIDDQAAFSFFSAPRNGYDTTWDLPPVFVTGVVYDDTNGNGVMDLGEGLSGVSVTVGTTTVTTNAGGGYSVLIEADVAGNGATFAVSATGAGSGTVTITDSANVQVDFVQGRSSAIVRDGGTTDRWSGQDRFLTAVEVSQQTHPTGANTVYLALGTNFPDAIAAGPAAAQDDAPILLTFTNSLPAATTAELDRLDPSSVVVVGGSAAISQSVLDAVESTLPGATVTRRWGVDRFATSVALSEAVYGPSTSTVYVATGLGFPDALVTAPAAIHDGAPLLLVRNDALPASVAAELDRLNPNTIVVVGGTTAVQNSVITALEGHANTVTRIDGADRYVIAAAVSEATFDAPADTVFVAVGTNYPDALAGGAATGVLPGPMLLVPSTGIPSAIHDELLRLAPKRIIVLGGTAVLPAALADQLARYLA